MIFYTIIMLNLTSFKAFINICICMNMYSFLLQKQKGTEDSVFNMVQQVTMQKRLQRLENKIVRIYLYFIYINFSGE